MISEEKAATSFAVVELRRYAMQPGKRDTLISLFEREFIETQERAGMVPVGHYRDLDDPDSYVWFRGFERFEARREALATFYGSRTWLDNRTEANSTLVDSDNVLMLRNARSDSGFDLEGLTRPDRTDGSKTATRSFVAASIFMLERPVDDSFIAAFETRLLAQLQACGKRIAYLVTEERPNDFPALPVREEFAFLVVGVCESTDALGTWSRAVERSLRDLGSPTLNCETLRLEPAARSLFR
jgi:hypothetical protein